MVIDYEAVRIRVNELNQSAIKVVDMSSTLENGALFGEPLNLEQISGIQNRLKSEADNLQTITGKIKALVSV